ncbi:MAG: hypothetical protein ACQETL_12780 [Bacteroidota bacterium]
MSLQPNYYKALLSVFVILYSFTSISQKDFRNGYIITNQNDTINGQIEYQSFYNNSTSCIFRKNGKTKTYLPKELFGYGFKDYKFYKSGILEGKFVEFLVEGKISLFRYENSYIVQKDDEIFELIGRNNGSENNKNKWKGIITYITSDCEIISRTSISKLAYTEKGLKKVIIEYNNCKGENIKVFKYNEKWIAFKLGGIVGVNYSKLKAAEIPLSKNYLSENYNSIDPKFGLSFYFTSPAFTDKIGIEIQPSFFNSYYYSYKEINGPNTELYDSYMNIQTISIPFAVRYNILNGEYNIFTNIGVNVDYYLSSSNSYISEIQTQNVVNRFTGENDFKLNENNYGLIMGIGFIQQKFLKSGLFLGYVYTPHITQETGLRLNVSSLSLNLIIYTK